MTLWIDADGCPVVDSSVALCRRFGVACVIVCDTAHEIRREGAQTRVVSTGADSVDFALVNACQAGDIVVTQDFGLAAMCLSRGAHPIRQDGTMYTDENIGGMLEGRAMAKKILRAGGRLKGPKKRTAAQDAAFIAALEELLAALY